MTEKQYDILYTIFRFRFVSSTQIQILLGHKDRSRINKWLRDLVQRKYIGRMYTSKWGENKIPGIYFLRKKGIFLLAPKKSSYTRKLLHERSAALMTKEHAMQAFQFYAILHSFAKKHSHTLSYRTKAQLSFESIYTYIKPDAYMEYETSLGKKCAYIEIDLGTEFGSSLQRKLKTYVDFYFSQKWKAMGTTFPFLVFVCRSPKRERYIQMKLEKVLEKYDFPPIVCKIGTFTSINEKGMGAQIWAMPFQGEEKYKLI